MATSDAIRATANMEIRQRVPAAPGPNEQEILIQVVDYVESRSDDSIQVLLIGTRNARRAMRSVETGPLDPDQLPPRWKRIAGWKTCLMAWQSPASTS